MIRRYDSSAQLKGISVESLGGPGRRRAPLGPPQSLSQCKESVEKLSLMNHNYPGLVVITE